MCPLTFPLLQESMASAVALKVALRDKEGIGHLMVVPRFFRGLTVSVDTQPSVVVDVVCNDVGGIQVSTLLNFFFRAADGRVIS